VFHKDCVDRWLDPLEMGHNNFPVCRTQVLVTGMTVSGTVLDSAAPHQTVTILWYVWVLTRCFGTRQKMVSMVKFVCRHACPVQSANQTLGRTYFDLERARTNPIVSLNILTLFYSRGRRHELASMLDWALSVLAHRAYLDGTRYYETAEAFLFFATRLLCTARTNAALQTRLAPLLHVHSSCSLIVFQPLVALSSQRFALTCASPAACSPTWQTDPAVAD